jgi:FMN phosphatase YigB (HAD superfamily)
MFRVALDALGVRPGEALMVGDRSGHDGAAVEAGVAPLLLPPLTDVSQARLHLVPAACGIASR